ncbi:MAG: YtxH domain-containing protein [Elusimicrobia bacterium]|nr:YtxH domain-containing protein [Elusimicrobiota bacterium]
MADNNSGDGVLAFLIGGAVGAALGLLLAPRKGAETREMLTDWLEERRTKAGEFVREERDTLAQKKEKIEAAWEAGKKAYRETGGA